MKALVVDDSRTSRFFISRFAEEAGFEVTASHSPEEAVERVRQEKDFRIALLDWELIPLGDLTLIDLLRTASEYPIKPEYPMKIVVLGHEGRFKGLSVEHLLGADELIKKPFTRDIFVQTLTFLGIPAF